MLSNLINFLFYHASRQKAVKYIYRHSALFRQSYKFFLPKRITTKYNFEFTTYCNAKCIFCSYPKIAEDNTRLTVMSEATFNASLDYLRKLKGAYITMTPRVGEIFINKNWYKYMQAVLNEKNVVSLSVTTNAILLNEKNINKLLKLENSHKITFYISIGGMDRDSYKFMYGVDKSEVVNDNIKLLTKKFKENNLKSDIYVQFRVKEAKDIDLKKAHLIYNPYHYQRFFVNVTDSFFGLADLSEAKPKGLKISTLNADKKKPCLHVDAITFNSDGYIGLCGCVTAIDKDKDSLIIGKCGDDLEKIELNKKKVINDWYDGKVPKVCQTCDMYTARGRFD